ncbi:hypothetical protein N9933_01170 [bacterium]|nr:hypothetical protein [bacterium]
MNTRDTYKRYKKFSKKPVSIKEYLDINSLFIKYMISNVLNGESISLPERFGTLSIVGKKTKIKFDEFNRPKGLAPDWKRTKRLWAKNEEAKEKKQLVFHTNDHSDGIRYKFLWSKKRMFIKNKTLYSLILTRANKRAVAKNVKNGQEYTEQHGIY